MARPGFPVPKDKAETGAGLHCWVNCTFYGDTLGEVADKVIVYKREYPTQRYDTHTVGKKIHKHPDGYYYAKVKRWSTCD